MKRLLVHLAPRFGAEHALPGRIRELVSQLERNSDSSIDTVTALFAIDADPLRSKGAVHEAAIEVRGASEKAIRALLTGLAPQLVLGLDDLVHADLSSTLLGEDHVLAGSRSNDLRYQYLMRRKSGFDHAAYIDYYRNVHARFGVATPGIQAYVQFHVDPAGSRRMAAVTGAGGTGVDSITELYLASTDEFLTAIATSTVGTEAMEDEKNFVDRVHSVAFTVAIDQ